HARRPYPLNKGNHHPITPDFKSDVSSFSIDSGKTRILYSLNEKGYSRPHALDAKTFKEIKLPKLPPADQITYGVTSHDGRYTTIKVDTGVAPPESYVVVWP